MQDLRDAGVPLGFSSAAAATVAAEDEDERLDPRYNSHEAFAEWFDGEVRSLDDVEGAGENFDTVMEEWCRNNNHEIRDDGVYNMNILEAGNQDQEGALHISASISSTAFLPYHPCNFHTCP